MTDLSFEALRPEYELLWSHVISPGGVTRETEAFEQAKAIIEPYARSRFMLVQGMTGVPWFVTGIVLTREAGSPPNFACWLHNGDSMKDHDGHPRKTHNIPAGRPLDPRCTWEAGAVDAYEYESLTGKKDWSPAFVAWLLEKFNGFGYRLYHHIPSPYLWGGTVVQKRGKYDRDKHFDPHMMDPQIGGMAILAMLMQMDKTAKFETGTKIA
jgi:lysozyme family protein